MTAVGYRNTHPPRLLMDFTRKALVKSDRGFIDYEDPFDLRNSLLSFEYVMLGGEDSGQFLVRLINPKQQIEKNIFSWYCSVNPRAWAAARETGAEEWQTSATATANVFIRWGYASEAPRDTEDDYAMSDIHRGQIVDIGYEVTDAKDRVITLRIVNFHDLSLTKNSLKEDYTEEQIAISEKFELRNPSNVMSDVFGVLAAGDGAQSVIRFSDDHKNILDAEFLKIHPGPNKKLAKPLEFENTPHVDRVGLSSTTSTSITKDVIQNFYESLGFGINVGNITYKYKGKTLPKEVPSLDQNGTVGTNENIYAGERKRIEAVWTDLIRADSTRVKLPGPTVPEGKANLNERSFAESQYIGENASSFGPCYFFDIDTTHTKNGKTSYSLDWTPYRWFRAAQSPRNSIGILPYSRVKGSGANPQSLINFINHWESLPTEEQERYMAYYTPRSATFGSTLPPGSVKVYRYRVTESEFLNNVHKKLYREKFVKKAQVVEVKLDDNNQLTEYKAVQIIIGPESVGSISIGADDFGGDPVSVAAQVKEREEELRSLSPEDNKVTFKYKNKHTALRTLLNDINQKFFDRADKYLNTTQIFPENVPNEDREFVESHLGIDIDWDNTPYITVIATSDFIEGIFPDKPKIKSFPIEIEETPTTISIATGFNNRKDNIITDLRYRISKGGFYYEILRAPVIQQELYSVIKRFEENDRYRDVIKESTSLSISKDGTERIELTPAAENLAQDAYEGIPMLKSNGSAFLDGVVELAKPMVAKFIDEQGQDILPQIKKDLSFINNNNFLDVFFPYTSSEALDKEVKIIHTDEGTKKIESRTARYVNPSPLSTLQEFMKVDSEATAIELASKARQLASFKNRISDIEIVMLGVPEMDILSYETYKRDVALWVSEPRVPGTFHWLSGIYHIGGITHKISTSGYETTLKLIPSGSSNTNKEMLKAQYTFLKDD